MEVSIHYTSFRANKGQRHPCLQGSLMQVEAEVAKINGQRQNIEKNKISTRCKGDRGLRWTDTASLSLPYSRREAD